MNDSRSFWLQLHAIADELQQEGDSEYERALSLAELLSAMPADTRAIYAADLETVASALNELSRQYSNPRPLFR